MTATLAMYPFAGWRAATDSFWTDVRQQMPELPPLAPCLTSSWRRRADGRS